MNKCPSSLQNQFRLNLRAGLNDRPTSSMNQWTVVHESVNLPLQASLVRHDPCCQTSHWQYMRWRNTLKKNPCAQSAVTPHGHMVPYSTSGAHLLWFVYVYARYGLGDLLNVSANQRVQSAANFVCAFSMRNLVKRFPCVHIYNTASINADNLWF